MRSPVECKRQISTIYTDEDRQVTVDAYPTKWSTGNGLMHTGLTMTFYADLNIVNSIDTRGFNDTVSRCEVQPGVYNKNPGRFDEITHDDITGVVAGSVATGNTFHLDVANHGLKHFFFYDNDSKFSFSDFLGRQIWHTMFWLLSTKRAIFLPLLPILLIKLKLFKASSYSILHKYMMLSTLGRLYPRTKKFGDKIIKSSGLAGECRRYFNNPSHPVVDLGLNREAQ